MLDKKAVIDGVGRSISDLMLQEGFHFLSEEDSGLFLRQDEGITKGFRFRPIKKRNGSTHEISCSVSIRYDAIEDLLRPYLMKDYGGDEPPRDKATIGEGLFNIYAMPDFVSRWWRLSVTNESDFAKAGRRVFRDFRKYALPWFRKFETFEQLEAAYRGPKEGWPTAQQSDRLQHLLAIAVLRGDAEAFASLAADARNQRPRGAGGLALPDVVEGLRSELAKRIGSTA